MSREPTWKQKGKSKTHVAEFLDMAAEDSDDDENEEEEEEERESDIGKFAAYLIGLGADFIRQSL